MTYYKEQPTNVFGILARRKSGDDPRPEDEAKHATTFASGFGNQQIRDKIDQSGSPLTSVLKEKQATVVQAVQATNGEKRKLPDDSVRAPVFRRKKLVSLVRSFWYNKDIYTDRSHLFFFHHSFIADYR